MQVRRIIVVQDGRRRIGLLEHDSIRTDDGFSSVASATLGVLGGRYGQGALEIFPAAYVESRSLLPGTLNPQQTAASARGKLRRYVNGLEFDHAPVAQVDRAAVS